MTTRALIVLTDGFEDIEAIAPIDVLNRVGVEVTVASLKPGPVKAAYGTNIIADTTLEEVTGEFAAIICPGGKQNAIGLASSDRVRTLLQEQHKAGRLAAAICAAPSHVLGESAKLLQGKRATGDPGFREKLKNTGAIVTDEDVTLDGNILTATGPGTALSFALSIAAYLVGAEKVRPFSERWGVPFV